MATTVAALGTLVATIPVWNGKLDELNVQIAQRQIELARCAERDQHPPTPKRSLRNQGSTESLRPKDNDNEDTPDPDVVSTTQEQDGHPPAKKRTPARTTGTTTPTTPKANSNPRSNPRPSPNALTRQSSQPTPPPQARSGPAVLRKQKTESLVSGESLMPRYRTRSMIIVYYDSQVQTAFEDLVKSISGTRNGMRKSKMAAKMDDMRKAAELEVETEGGTEEAEEEGDVHMPPRLLAAQQRSNASRIAGGVPGEGGFVPNLQYVSTRGLRGPEGLPRPPAPGTAGTFGMLKGYRRSGAGGERGGSDIFDELDKNLEWCQSECEKAAHQFLREGECNSETAAIKQRLLEVNEAAETETERLKKHLAEGESPVVARQERPMMKARELKSIQMRRDIATAANDLQVDDQNMEADDDEAVEDLEPQKLVFKRSRDAY